MNPTILSIMRIINLIHKTRKRRESEKEIRIKTKIKQIFKTKLIKTLELCHS